MSNAGFANPWYANMIAQFDTGDPNEPTTNVARAILVGACILGDALDGLAQSIRDESSDSYGGPLSASVNNIAEAIELLTHQLRKKDSSGAES